MNAERIAELKRVTGDIATSKYVRGRMFGKVECAELEAILSDYEAALPLLEAVRVIPKDYVSMYPFLGESGEYWHDVHGAALAYRERSRG